VEDEAERLVTVLRAFPDAGLRSAFLRDYLGAGNDVRSARAFDALCAAAARAESAAREPMLALVLLLAALGDDPVLDRLGHLAAEHGLRSLGRLLRRAPELGRPSDARRLVADYGSGRELSLGERKFLARRPTRARIDRLLRDPHPDVIAQLLGNPLLTENDVIRFTARRPAHAEALRVLSRTDWLYRPRIRMALLYNPGTPSSIAIPLLGACTRPELVEIRTSPDCSASLRSIAEELLTMRSTPPAAG